MSRRDLIRLLGGAAALIAANPACKSDSGSSSSVFTDDERSALAAYADAIIPPDDEPGGAALGAVDYIEKLLTAFDNTDIPKIFAGGPYSGRQPFADPTGHASTNFPTSDFQNFIELDRVNDASWRLKIFGSAGVPNGGPNDKISGPIVALKDQIKTGLAAAMASSDTPLTQLAPTDLLASFNSQPQDFKDLLIDLVTQAAFGAPEYGGNLGLAGWKMVYFEGDSQPLGYSQFDGANYVERADSPLSTANPGPDPMPISPDVDALLSFVINFLGGRSA